MIEYVVQHPWDLSALVLIALDAAAVMYVRARHRPLWEKLGSPPVLHSNMDASSWSMSGFLFKFRFLRVADPLLWLLGLAWYFSAIGTIYAVLKHG